MLKFHHHLWEQLYSQKRNRESFKKTWKGSLLRGCEGEMVAQLA
jgi:hypothetical protein